MTYWSGRLWPWPAVLCCFAWSGDQLLLQKCLKFYRKRLKFTGVVDFELWLLWNFFIVANWRLFRVFVKVPTGFVQIEPVLALWTVFALQLVWGHFGIWYSCIRPRYHCVSWCYRRSSFWRAFWIIIFSFEFSIVNIWIFCHWQIWS